MRCEWLSLQGAPIKTIESWERRCACANSEENKLWDKRKERSDTHRLCRLETLAIRVKAKQ